MRVLVLLPVVCAAVAVEWDAPQSAPEPPINANGLLAVDWNGDDFVDMIVLAELGSRVDWAAGDGAGGFAAFEPLVTNQFAPWHSLLVADIDADANPDLILASNSAVVWFEGQGGGAVSPTSQSLGDVGIDGNEISSVAMGRMNSTSSITKKDLVTSEWSPGGYATTSIHIQPGLNAASHEDWRDIPWGYSKATHLYAGVDMMEGDGFPDVVALYFDGSVVWYQSTEYIIYGRRLQQAKRSSTRSLGQRSFYEMVLLYDVNSELGLVIADMNGDGYLDLVYQSNLDQTLRWCIIYDDILGGEAFQEYVIDDTNGDHILALQVADVDHDMDLDIVVCAVPMTGGGVASLKWSENSGEGIFLPLSLIGDFTYFGTAAVNLVAFDPDGDTDYDLALLQSDAGFSSIELYKNLFIDETPFPTSAPSTLSPSAAPSAVEATQNPTPIETIPPTPSPLPSYSPSTVPELMSHTVSMRIQGETEMSWSLPERETLEILLSDLHGVNVTLSLIGSPEDRNLQLSDVSGSSLWHYNITKVCVEVAEALGGDDELFQAYVKQLESSGLSSANTATSISTYCDGISVSSILLVDSSEATYGSIFGTGEEVGEVTLICIGLSLLFVAVASLSPASIGVAPGSTAAERPQSPAATKIEDTSNVTSCTSRTLRSKDGSRSSARSASVKILASQAQYLAVVGLLSGKSASGSYAGFTSPLRAWVLLWIEYSGDLLGDSLPDATRRSLQEAESSPDMTRMFVGNSLAVLGGFVIVLFLSLIWGSAILAKTLAKERESLSNEAPLSSSVSSSDVERLQSGSSNICLYFPHTALLWLLFVYEGAVTAQAAVLAGHDSVRDGALVAASILLFLFSIALFMYAVTLHKKRASSIEFCRDDDAPADENILKRACRGIIASWKRGESMMEWATLGDWRSRGPEVESRDCRQLRIGFEPFFIDFTDTGALFFHWTLFRTLILCIAAGWAYESDSSDSSVVASAIFLVAICVDTVIIAVTRPLCNAFLNTLTGVLCFLDAGIACVTLVTSQLDSSALLDDAAVILGLVSLGIVLVCVYIDSAVVILVSLVDAVKSRAEKYLRGGDHDESSQLSQPSRLKVLRRAIPLWPRIAWINLSLAARASAQRLWVTTDYLDKEAENKKRRSLDSFHATNPLYAGEKEGE